MDPGQIKEARLDLSPSFIAGVKASFPSAAITFDRFHVVKRLNEAMDQVRKVERKGHAAIKGHQYTFLKNHGNLSETQQQELAEMIQLYPTLGEAYRLKTLFNDLWDMPDKPATEASLEQCCAEVEAAKLPAFLKFTKTVRAHWSGIVHFVESRLSNGLLEGISHKVQLAKRRARGYRNSKSLLPMAYQAVHIVRDGINTGFQDARDFQCGYEISTHEWSTYYPFPDEPANV